MVKLPVNTLILIIRQLNFYSLSPPDSDYVFLVISLTVEGAGDKVFKENKHEVSMGTFKHCCIWKQKKNQKQKADF